MNWIRDTKESSLARDPRVRSIVVTGWGIHLPNVDRSDLMVACASGPDCPPERAHELLGRKGLLYKEAATRLALCAVHRTLDLPPGAPRRDCAPDPKTAVIVSSNLGNTATVHNIVRTIRNGTGRDVSPLDAPNASSNIIASTVAIWFRFGGPNLTVCSGATSGLDAIALAQIVLRTGRADRVVVVGAEPDDEIATALYRRRDKAASVHGARLRAGAACVVLELMGAATSGMPLLGPVRYGSDIGAGTDQASLVIGPAEMAPGALRVMDLSRQLGDTYGALGVLQVAVGAALIATEVAGRLPFVTLICGDPIEGWRSALVSGKPVAQAAMTT
jgi:3-oxoacyl-[acyl-carrier-protein] synthase II